MVPGSELRVGEVIRNDVEAALVQQVFDSRVVSPSVDANQPIDRGDTLVGGCIGRRNRNHLPLPVAAGTSKEPTAWPFRH